MQILDWALLALVLLAAALAVRKIIRDRRAGKCGCGAVQICDLGNSAHARDARESCMQSMCDERLAAYCGNCAGCAAHCGAACAAYPDTADVAHCTQNTNDRAG